MNIIRTPQSRHLIETALEMNGDENLTNASFMLTPKQVEVLRALARENRYLNSQGAVLRYILDDWMRSQLDEGVDGH